MDSRPATSGPISSWRTVAAMVTRVVADGRDTNDLLSGLVRIGIDEIAYRKGHRYLTVVVDHGTGRLVWAAEGRNQNTLGRFFDQLGAERGRPDRRATHQPRGDRDHEQRPSTGRICSNSNCAKCFGSKVTELTQVLRNPKHRSSYHVLLGRSVSSHEWSGCVSYEV